MRFRYSGGGSAGKSDEFSISGLDLAGAPTRSVLYERYYIPVSNLPADADLNYSIYDNRYGTGVAEWYVLQVYTNFRTHKLEFDRDKGSERKFGNCDIVRSNINIGYSLTKPAKAYKWPGSDDIVPGGFYYVSATTQVEFNKLGELFCNEWLKDYLASIDVTKFPIPTFHTTKTGSGGLITQPTHVYRNGGAMRVQNDLYVNYMKQVLAVAPERYKRITEGVLRLGIYCGSDTVLYQEFSSQYYNMKIDGGYIEYLQDLTGEPIKRGICGVQFFDGVVTNDAYYGTYDPYVYTVDHTITTREGGFFDYVSHNREYYIDENTNLMEIMNNFINDWHVGPYINKPGYKFCVYPGTVTLNAHNYKTDKDETIEYVPTGYFLEVLSIYNPR